MNTTIEEVLNTITPDNYNDGPRTYYSVEEAQVEFLLDGLELIGKRMGDFSNRFQNIGLAIGTTDIEVPDIFIIAITAAEMWDWVGVADAVRFLASNGNLTESAVYCLQHALQKDHYLFDSNRKVRITLNVEELK